MAFLIKSTACAWVRGVRLLLLLTLLHTSTHAVGQSNKTSSPAVVPEKLSLPSPKEATDAILELFGMADMKKQATVKLGTCIPAMDAQYAGQVACTIAVKIGASTSETQADFYRTKSKWHAQPSSSQEKLPFPDPAL